MTIFFFQWNFGGVKGKVPAAFTENSSSLFDDELDFTKISENEDEEVQ